MPGGRGCNGVEKLRGHRSIPFKHNGVMVERSFIPEWLVLNRPAQDFKATFYPGRELSPCDVDGFSSSVLI